MVDSSGGEIMRSMIHVVPWMIYFSVIWRHHSRHSRWRSCIHHMMIMVPVVRMIMWHFLNCNNKLRCNQSSRSKFTKRFNWQSMRASCFFFTSHSFILPNYSPFWITTLWMVLIDNRLRSCAISFEHSKKSRSRFYANIQRADKSWTSESGEWWW